MAHSLIGKTFKLYRSGVYEGKFIFGEDKLLWCAVDPQTRVQLQPIPFEARMTESLFDFEELYANLALYADAEWAGDRVVLSDGARYNRYLSYRGRVRGEDVEAWLWARRGEPPIMDVVSVDGAVVAFVMPGRISGEMLVLEGFESVTPLTKYDDPLLSRAEYGIRPLGNHFVKTRDGVNLATEVFLPVPLGPDAVGSAVGSGAHSTDASIADSIAAFTGDPIAHSAGASATDSIAAFTADPIAHSAGDSGKFPTIVVRTCYGKARDMHRCLHWVNRGYAFVIQDVRGRSDSEGELVPFYYEREDAYDLFDWIAAQPWSDGNIGMWGASYLGYTTTAAATSGHPNLKTAISEVNVGSPFFMDTVRRGGAVCSWPLLSWTLGQSVSNRTDFDVFRGWAVNPDEVVKMRPIADIPWQVLGKRSGPWDIWAQHYQWDEFWQHCDNGTYAHNIKIPMLILSGWHDGDALGVQETWRFLTEHDVPGRRIILGPWPHALNAFRDVLDTEYGDNAIDYDFDTRTIRWFDRWLKGIANGEDEQPRAKFYVGGAGENKWHESSEWPPAEATLTELYLDSDGGANSMHGNGRLVTEPVIGHRFDSYVYDPENAATGCGKFEPSVLNALHARQDYLVYETEPLQEPVAVAGNLSAVFYAASSAVDTDFFVTVSDVDEKGVARKISTNGIRAEFRNWPEVPSALLEPGKVEKYHLYLHFAGHVFQPGHKIRVDICSADYITFFPNTNTGIDPYTDPKPIVATQSIYHGKDYPSCVRLPILYGAIP